MIVTETSVKSKIRLHALLRLGLVVSGLGVVAVAAAMIFSNMEGNIVPLQLTDVTLSGVIEVVTSENIQAQTDTDNYYLTTSDNHLQLILSDGIQVPRAGDSVVVEGTQEQDTVTVSTLTVQEEVAATVSMGKVTNNALTGMTTAMSTDNKALVVMGYYPGQSAPTTPTQTDAQAVMFGPAPSVADFFHDNSFGKYTLTGTVTPWIPLAAAQTADIWAAGSNALHAAKAADPSLDLHQFQHLVFISPYDTNITMPDGQSLVGATSLWSPDGYVTMSISVIRSTIVGLPRPTPLAPYIMVHEFGHQLGLLHAGLLYCTSVPIDTSCRVFEYGEHDDVMGSAYVDGYAQNLNAMHVDNKGWFDASNIQTVVASGNYTLEPIENRTTGLKAIKIPRGNNDYLYLEYRQPIGYDVNLESGTAFDGPLLHVRNIGYANSYSITTDTVSVDPTPPAWFTYNALELNQTFTDPATGTIVTTTAISPSSVTVNVQLGTTKFVPSISMPTPITNHAYSSPVAFTANASSPVGIQKVDFFLDGASTPFATDTTEPYAASFDASAYANGTTIRAYVLATGNDGGLASTAPIPFQITNVVADTTPPTVTITSPAEGAVVTSVATFQATINDANGISTSRFYVDCPGTTVTSCAYTYVGYPYLLSKSLTSGTHTLRVQAQDPSGNSTVSPARTFLVDATYPQVKLSAPINGATVSGVISLAGTASDDIGVTRIDAYVDGRLVGSYTNPIFAILWDSRSVADGGHSWYVIAYDRAGHMSYSAASTMIVKNAVAGTPGGGTTTLPPAPPILTLVGASGNTVTGQSGLARIDGDVSGVIKADMLVDGAKVVTKTSPPYTFYIDSPKYPNGSHTVRVVLYTAGSVKADRSLTVITKNALTATIASPKKNATVKRTITISPTVRGGSRVKSIEYILDGKKRIAKTIKSPFAYKWNTKGTKKGAHTLTVRVTDLKGKVVTASVKVKVAN